MASTKVEVDPSDHEGQEAYERAVGSLRRLHLDVRKTGCPFTLEKETREDGTFDIILSLKPPRVVNQPEKAVDKTETVTDDSKPKKSQPKQPDTTAPVVPSAK